MSNGRGKRQEHGAIVEAIALLANATGLREAPSEEMRKRWGGAATAAHLEYVELTKRVRAAKETP